MRSDAAPGTVHLPLWSGMQPVSALWFDGARWSAEARAQRMLACWRSGAQALRFAEGDLLRWPQPEWLACESLPGLALCLIDHGTLSSAPLGSDERDAVRGCDLVLVRGARAIGMRLGDGAALDLSAWIEIGDYALHDTFDCSASVKTAAIPPLQGRDVRDVLGDAIPPPSAERDAFVKRAIAAGEAKARSDARRPGRPGASWPGLGIGSALLGTLAAWLGAGAGHLAGSGSSAAQRGGVAARRAPRRPSAWREALTRLAIATRASQLIGWRQGAYLRRMMKLFDEGDLGEALRHALPIDSTDASLGQSFGAPGRRQDLRLGGAGDGSVNLNLGPEMQQHLREMYRKTFERLDRQGRIDEAVFVLGELLNARQECLDYLERHGRHAQAAELALAWDMPTATTVRLLLLAGDWTRALQVARRDGQFGDAVLALEKTRPELAVKLRLLWGESLADRGEWLAAADAVWPVPQARNLAVEWLRIAEDGGAVLSARALVRRAEKLPDTLDKYGERILALALPGDGAEAEIAAAARSALADALLDVQQRNPAVAGIANALLPAIAADRAAGRNDLGKSRLNKLLSLGGDSYLKADLPAWSLPPQRRRTSVWARDTPAQHVAPAAGLVSIHDVAPLPDQRYLIALGEAGVLMVDARGRTLQRYPVPADALVVADNGRVALAVARREALSRVSRLDLVRHAASDLGSLRIDAHAREFDGAAWSVIADNRILVIDTAKSLRDVVWHVGDLPGRLVAVRYMPTFELYLLRTAHGFEHWTYSLPTRQLTNRDTVEIDTDLPVLLMPFGRFTQPQMEPPVGDVLRVGFTTFGGRHRLELKRPQAAGAASAPMEADDIRLQCSAAQQGIVVAVAGPSFMQLALCRLGDGAAVAHVDWAAGAAPRFRESGQHLLFFDREGRVLDLGADHDTRTAFSVC